MEGDDQFSSDAWREALAQDRAERERTRPRPPVPHLRPVDDGAPFPPPEAYEGEFGSGAVDRAGRAEFLRSQLRTPDEIEPALTSAYLVKRWLDRGAASVAYGESNVGKTFFALDLALHVAAGLPWNGCRVSPGPVIYIAAEGGHGIRNRLAAVRADRPHLLSERFHLLPATVNLFAPFDAEALAQVATQLDAPPSLIVIDTLARSMGEGDENTAKDMGAFVRSVDALRAQTGAHVLVIHHSGKDRSLGARGSSVLRGAVDTEIELTREGTVIIAEARKQRDMPTGATVAYTLRDVVLGLDEDGDEVSSAVVDAAEPVKRQPKLTGQAEIALQAFGDALAHHGEVRTGDMFPHNRQCVSLETWRQFCDRHELSGGETATAKRTAFHKAKKVLLQQGLIRVVDGHAWRVEE